MIIFFPIALALNRLFEIWNELLIEFGSTGSSKNNIIFSSSNKLSEKFSGNILISFGPNVSTSPPGIGPCTAHEKIKNNVIS